MKTALVTGTKLGVGNALVTELSKRGYKVIATSRDPNYLIQNKEKNGWGEEVLIEQLDLDHTLHVWSLLAVMILLP